MKTRCKNGIDFDECDNKASNGYDGYCELCAEKRFDDYNESLMQGYTVTSLQDQMREAQKVK
jgi:hypothetical protein